MADQPTNPNRDVRGAKVGVVTSDKRDKTCTVSVEYLQQHSKYGKYVRRRTKFQVHDENNTCKVGDKVEIAMCRPLSKTKSWRLVRVVDASVSIDL